MSLTTTDMQTFVTLLEQDATLRQQIKKILFPELDIEQTLARLTRLLERMDSRMAAQEQALAEVRTEVTELRTEMSEVRTEVTELRTEMSEVRTEVSELRQDVAELKGKSLEAFYHRRAAAIFGRYIANGREASNQVANQLRAAFAENLISDEEYDQILAVDLFFGGKLHPSGQEVLLVMEASWYAQLEDVQRAADRAAIGQRGCLPTIPVVGGEGWSDEAIKLATERAVVRTVNGRLDRASWQQAMTVWLAETPSVSNGA